MTGHTEDLSPGVSYRHPIIESDEDVSDEFEEDDEPFEDEIIPYEEPQQPQYSEMELNSLQAIAILNEERAAKGLSAVQPDYALTLRCYQYAEQMNRMGRLNHDRSVYGTPERENIAGAWGYPLTVEESMRMWNNSAPHAASMYDRKNFPTAAYGGYAQVGGFSCLRLCPYYRPQQGPCSDASAMTFLSRTQ